MYIYSVKNTKRHKRYIGATTNFFRRRNEHLHDLRTGQHSNGHLQSAWNIDGEHNFVIRLVTEVDTIEELDELENVLVAKYGDYNIRTGGLKNFGHSEESKRKMSETRKRRKIPSPTKGMTFIRSVEVRDGYANRQRPQGYPILISPEGKEVEVVNVRRFSEKEGIYYSGVMQLVNEDIDYYKGWIRKGTEYINRGHTISQRKRPGGFPQVISPNGDMYRIEILREFCRNYGLSVSNMSQLVNGNKQQYKGWTVFHPTTEKTIG